MDKVVICLVAESSQISWESWRLRLPGAGDPNQTIMDSHNHGFTQSWIHTMTDFLNYEV